MGEETTDNLNTGGTGGTTDTGVVATMPAFTQQLDGSLQKDERVSQWYKTQTESGKKGTISDLVNDHLTLAETFAKMKGEVEGKVKVPGEKATPEEQAAFRKALGIPESPDGYEIKRPEKLPEGMEYDVLLEKGFKEEAFKLGITPTVAKGLFDWYMSREIGMYSGINKIIADNKEKAVNTLKDIWHGDTYAENIEKTSRTFFESLKRLSPPAGLVDIAEELKETAFSNPAIVWYFSKVFDLVSIDKLGGGSPSGGKNSSGEGNLEFPSMEGK